MGINNREFAIEELNRFFDVRGVLEEDRIQYELTKEDKEEMKYLNESEKLEFLEKKDTDRELVIKEIQKGNIKISDTGEITQKLKIAVQDEDGKILCDSLKFKNKDIKVRVLQNQLMGLNPKDTIGHIAGRIAARTGTSRHLILALDEDDYTIAVSILGIFLKSNMNTIYPQLFHI